jgi:hypothetical protein
MTNKFIIYLFSLQLIIIIFMDFISLNSKINIIMHSLIYKIKNEKLFNLIN